MMATTLVITRVMMVMVATTLVITRVMMVMMAIRTLFFWLEEAHPFVRKKCTYPMAIACLLG